MVYRIKYRVPEGVQQLILALPTIFNSSGVWDKRTKLLDHIDKDEMSEEDYEFIFERWADLKPSEDDPHKIAKRIFDIIKDEMFEYS